MRVISAAKEAPPASSPVSSSVDADLLDLPICTTCGTQFSTSFLPDKEDPLGCRICADPRQYVRPGGLQLTTLREMRSGEPKAYKNEIRPVSSPTQEVVWEIFTTPQFAIGQRAFFVKTPRGNILWDLIAFLDADTEAWIKSHGGLHAIVISHPHYYTTHSVWAQTFGCQIWIAPEDREWLNFPSEGEDEKRYRWLTETKTEVLEGGSGFAALKVGGHYPGSLCANHKDRLFIADTLVTVPSAYNPAGRDGKGHTAGRVAYAFMWSIPNMITLSSTEINHISAVLKTVEFSSTHGAFVGMDVSVDVKRRIEESARVAIASMRSQRALGK